MSVSCAPVHPAADAAVVFAVVFAVLVVALGSVISQKFSLCSLPFASVLWCVLECLGVVESVFAVSAVVVVCGCCVD